MTEKKNNNDIDERRLLQGWVFRLAHRMMEKHGLSRSEALKLAYRNRKLQEMLGQGEVTFWYQKEDLSLRRAIGTLRKDLIPQPPNEAVAKRKCDDDKVTFVYYDLEKKGFRSFRAFSIISFYKSNTYRK